MQRPGGSGLPEVVHITQMAQNIKDEEEDVVLGNRRVALKPHAARIRTWVDEGRGDDWIANELNTTPSSVQSFRSRNSIYRRDPVRRGRLSEHPVVLQENDEGIVHVIDVRHSEDLPNEWLGYLRHPAEDLQIIVTQYLI